MNILKFFFSVFLIFSSFQCTSKNPVVISELPVRDLTPQEQYLINSDNTFGLNLFRELNKTQTDTNVFISPVSIAMALGMTYNGAAGSTESAMRSTLEFGDLTNQEINESYKSVIELLTGLDSKVLFQIANSIWYRLGFQVEPSFIDINRTWFNAEVSPLDFNSPEAVNTINQWVNDHTNGKIEEIIDSISPMTVMFLINAIYFLGDWTYQFDPDLTRNADFFQSDGSGIPCRMMEQQNEFSYMEAMDFHAVDLPYGDGLFSMTLILPKSGKTVDQIISNMTTGNWSQWTASFAKQELILQIPKFTLEYNIKLNDVLDALGMSIAFDPSLADFTKINASGGLFISKVLHKTYIEVDEEGTEAAAVTSVEINYTSVPLTLRFDRPFVFVIWEHHSGTLLFLGKLVEPE